MQTPLVSIVLPTYNGSRYLREAVQSCLDQTYTNWELIIVDDASNDDTPSIISHFVELDSRIRSIRHETNRKLPAALNTGFIHTTGDYLTWTSDDNMYRPNALEEMLHYFYCNPTIEFVYTDYTIIDNNENILRCVEVVTPDNLVFINCIGPSFMYTRALYEQLIGFDEDLFLAEDYDYWLRASQYTILSPLHKNLYLYRKHDNNLSNRKVSYITEVSDRALQKNLPQLIWIPKRLRSDRYLQLMLGAIQKGHIMFALKCFLHALVLNPFFVLYRSVLIIFRNFRRRRIA